MIKKMSEYFHVDWRLDIFRFWLQLAGGLISLTVRTAEEQPQQQPVCQWWLGEDQGGPAGRLVCPPTSSVLPTSPSGQHHLHLHQSKERSETGENWCSPQLEVSWLSDYPGSEEREWGSVWGLVRPLLCSSRGSIVRRHTEHWTISSTWSHHSHPHPQHGLQQEKVLLVIRFVTLFCS